MPRVHAAPVATLGPMADHFVETCIEHARELVDGRSIVVAGYPLAGATRRIHAWRELGAARCLVIASGIGTGPLPDPAETESVVVPVEAHDMMGEMRATEVILADPPPSVIAALDRFDPDRDAMVFIASVEASTMLGERPA